MAFIKDPHSLVVPGMPLTTHVDLNLQVHFTSRQLEGEAWLTFDTEGPTVLDTRDLTIMGMTDAETETNVQFELGPKHKVLGRPLRFYVPPCMRVRIKYRTSPEAKGLQWLPAELTAGKKHPIMFTQGQSINARSYMPCQDSPGIRFTVEARLTAPDWARCLMVGEHVETQTWSDPWVTEQWKMEHPIPAYLVAFWVGETASHDISPRIRAYAEPSMIDAAAYEFAEAEAILERAVKLFGRFRWGRFDFLVMPPSFPYGGMENQRLTFFSPTVIAGDRSQICVLDHELGHFWFGNLVTNATWSDFWLNEGWTTYAQLRMREVADGSNAMLLELAVEVRELHADFRRWKESGKPGLTALFTNLTENDDPDDCVSNVPYTKGALFLLAIEAQVGRQRFDPFALAYIERFAFQSISTEGFLAFVEEHFPGVLKTINADEWIHGYFLPDGVPEVECVLVQQVETAVADGTNVSLDDLEDWSSQQWQLYLEILDNEELDIAFLRRLDARFSLSAAPNMDIRANFARLVPKMGHLSFGGLIEDVLTSVGRIKYLRPIYAALAKTEKGFAHASQIFARAKPDYHPHAVEAIEIVLKEARQRLARAA